MGPWRALLLVTLVCLATSTLDFTTVAASDEGSLSSTSASSVTSSSSGAFPGSASVPARRILDERDDEDNDYEKRQKKQDEKEGKTEDKRKGLKSCKDDVKCCNDNDRSKGEKKANVEKYKGDRQCSKDFDGDKKVDDDEKGRDMPWTCTLPSKFCNCSDQVWSVAPWKVGNISSAAQYVQTKTSGQKQFLLPYRAGVSSRDGCCTACGAANNGTTNGTKNYYCAYWMHYVPSTPPSCTSASNCMPNSCSSNDNANSCGHCLIWPPGAQPLPACDTDAPICKGEDDDDGKYAYKATTYATVGKGCPGAKNDPHFVGAMGTHFDFNGVPDKSFCLVTDSRFQVNMKMRGYYDTRTVGASILKDGKAVRTWIKSMGIMWLDPASGAVHQLKFSARDGKQPERGQGYLESMEIDGETLPRMVPGDSISKDGGITVKMVGYEKEGGGYFDVDAYEIHINKRMTIELRLRIAHPLLQTKEDAMTHINVRFLYLEHSSSTHGVLGQTFRPGRERRAMDYTALSALMGKDIAADSEMGHGFLDGTAVDYVTSDVLSSDCKYSAFNGKVMEV